MRFVTFVHSSSASPRLGALLPDDTLLDLTSIHEGEAAFGSMLAFLDAGAKAADAAAEDIQRAGSGGHAEAALALAHVRLLAPIPRPRKNVFCVGLNYRSHVEANAAALGIRPEIPELPLFFTKPPTAVIGPDAPIQLDARVTQKLDYEVELGVIIGLGGTWIAESDALDHVFGYTLVNDVSARDVQWRSTQMFFGKGQDSYCPVGPWIVTRDELGGDATGLEVTCLVNGEQRQRDTTSEMVFGVARIVSELSKGLTL